MSRLFSVGSAARDRAEKPLTPGEGEVTHHESARDSSSDAHAGGEGLLELLDEGWFTGKVWAGGGGGWLGGGFSLSTIKEAQNEADDHCEDEETEARPNTADFPEIPLRSPSANQASASPARSSPAAGEPTNSSDPSDQGKASGTQPEGDGGGSWRRRGSPQSSDEETKQGRQARRRGRSKVRQRKKERSASAENTRRPWCGGESSEGSTRGGHRAQGRLLGTATPPSRPSQPMLEEREGQPRFLRTRSVSDYDARGARGTSLWDTPPGSRSKSQSLTDADVEELQGFLDLGFKFRQTHMNPQITATLPALKLYQAVGTVQQRLLQKRRSVGHIIDSDTSTPATPDPSEGLGNNFRSSMSSASLPDEPTWSIADPSDDPAEVKNNLRLWAQAVASTVRQTC